MMDIFVTFAMVLCMGGLAGALYWSLQIMVITHRMVGL